MAARNKAKWWTEESSTVECDWCAITVCSAVDGNGAPVLDKYTFLPPKSFARLYRPLLVPQGALEGHIRFLWFNYKDTVLWLTYGWTDWGITGYNKVMRFDVKAPAVYNHPAYLELDDAVIPASQPRKTQ